MPLKIGEHTIIEIIFIIWALLVFCREPCQAQLIGRYDEEINLSSFPYHIMTFGTQHGLPVNQVEGLGQDPKSGALVLSTANGLYQFDGYAFRTYREHFIYNNKIFFKILSSNLYEQLLGYTMNGELYHFKEIPELLGIYDAVDIQREYLLSIDSLGILKYAEHSDKKPFTYPTGIKDAKFIYRLHPDTILISDQSKTYRFLSRSGKLEVFFDSPLIDFQTDPKKHTGYFLTKTGLYKIDENGTPKIELQLSDDQYFLSMLFTNDALMVNASAGLYYMFGGFLFKYTEDDILPTNALRAFMMEDLTGTIFIGTSNKGLLKLSRKRVINLFSQSKNFIGSYGSVIFDSFGVLYTIAGSKIVKIISQNEYKILNSESLVSEKRF